MADVGVVNRVRMSMRGLQLGQEITDVDAALLADAPTVVKYANAIWANSGRQLFDSEGESREPTNTEKAQLVLRVLRDFFRLQLKRSRVPAAGQAAQADETVVVDDEVDTDLGAE